MKTAYRTNHPPPKDPVKPVPFCKKHPTIWATFAFCIGLLKAIAYWAVSITLVSGGGCLLFYGIGRTTEALAAIAHYNLHSPDILGSVILGSFVAVCILPVVALVVRFKDDLIESGEELLLRGDDE